MNKKEIQFLKLGDRMVRFDPDVLARWIEDESKAGKHVA